MTSQMPGHPAIFCSGPVGSQLSPPEESRQRRPGASPHARRGGRAIADIRVERRVRAQDQGRDWNLARRLQKRLLGDRTGALGVTLVDGGDTETCRALLSWGRRRLPADARGPSRFTSRRLLVLV